MTWLPIAASGKPEATSTTLMPASPASSSSTVSAGVTSMRRGHARQHQHGHRVDAHGGQRVDLLVHLHGADLGGEGRAGAAGQHHRGQQRPELAQQADGDQIGHIQVGAEAAHRHQRLEGQDQPHQHADQQHQRHRPHAGLVGGAQQIGAAELARPRRQAHHRHQRLAQPGEPVAGGRQPMDDHHPPGHRRRRRRARRLGQGLAGARQHGGDLRPGALPAWRRGAPPPWPAAAPPRRCRSSPARRGR